MYFVFLLNALQHGQEESPCRAASNYAAVTDTSITGSQGADGPFFSTILKNLIHINSFPGLLMLRTTKKHVGVSLLFFSFLFWFGFHSQNLDRFTQFLGFFSSYRIFLSHLLQNELHFGDQDAVIICLHQTGQRAELIIPSFPKHHHLNPGI